MPTRFKKPSVESLQRNATANAMAVMDTIRNRDQLDFQKLCAMLIGGFVIIAVVPLLMLFLIDLLPGERPPITADHKLRFYTFAFPGCFSIGVLYAWANRKGSLGDLVDAVLRDASHGADDDAAESIIAIIVMLIITCGGWLIVTSFLQLRVRQRIGTPDIARASVILTQLMATNTELTTAELIKHNENSRSFRTVIAYLMLHHWIHVAPDNRSIWLTTPGSKFLNKQVLTINRNTRRSSAEAAA